MLLEIWREFAAERTLEVPKLHIVGRRGWDIDDVAALLDGAADLAPHVTEESDLDEAAVRARLRGATALLFPSFAEGFGLPLAEAAVLGVPVLASDLPVFREIAGEGFGLLPPGDAAAWKAAILAAAENPDAPEVPRLADELLDWSSQAGLFTDLVEKVRR
jgi:glycosyltransferase involved in cell wall biosynthesis